jgi:hypothetical protein
VSKLLKRKRLKFGFRESSHRSIYRYTKFIRYRKLRMLLVCLWHVFRPSLMLASNARAYPSGGPQMPDWVWPEPTRVKHLSGFSLFWLFYNIGTWGQCYTTSYICNLQIFVLSNDKLFTLRNNLVNYENS